MTTIDFSINPKQGEFQDVVLSAAAGRNTYRQIAYGGAIRGGKSYAALGVLCILCAVYPNSRWVVFRKDFSLLKETTIPSLEKIIGPAATWTWHRSTPYYCEHQNGSRIIFMGENRAQDPELNGLLGLEISGVLLEQVEELSLKLYQMIQSRMGSWILDKMPKPLMLLTFNPTQEWVKEEFYDKWSKNELESHKYFIKALPSDNPTVTNDQWENWDRLDDRYKKQFIEGSWEDFSDKNNLFAFAWDRNKHVPKHLDPLIWNGDRNQTLYLSFDFNINPMCCAVIQCYNDTIYVLELIKLEHSNIYEMCATIKTKYPDFLMVITGDASGKNGSALVKDNLNYYVVIQAQLNLGMGQLKIPAANPRLEENQVLVNSMLAHYSIQVHPEKAKSLIYDMEHVKVDSDGSIIKANRNDPTQMSDALDTWRYYINTFHKKFLRYTHT